MKYTKFLCMMLSSIMIISSISFNAVADEANIEILSDDAVISDSAAIVENGTYSVPVKMVQAAKPSLDSMGNGALDGDAVITIEDNNEYIDLTFKAVTYAGLYGHLLNIWSYPTTDAMDYSWWGDSQYEIQADVTATYTDYGMNYTSGDTTEYEFIRTVRIQRDTAKESSIYIRISADAMSGFDQAARLDFDWDNAVIIDTPTTETTTESTTESTTEITTNSTTESTTEFATTTAEDTSVSDESTELTTEADSTDETSTEATTVVISIDEVSTEASTEETSTEVSTDASTETTTSKTNGGSSDETEDGKYWVEVGLWNANIDQASMGDCAFDNNRNALVTISGGTATVQIASNPVEVTGYTSALKDITSDSVSISVESTESFTTNTRYDGEEHTFDYVALFSFTTDDLSEEYIPVSICVPYTPMDSIADGGYIDARLKLDWSSLSKADDSATLKPDTSSSTGSSGGGSSVSEDSYTTGIKIEADANVFDDDTSFESSEITEGDIYELALELIGNDSFRLFDVAAIKDDNEVSPNGLALVYIPVEDEDGDNVILYRITESSDTTEAGKTQLEYKLSDDGKYYVISVKELGLFAVSTGEEAVEETEETTDVMLISEASDELFDDILNHWAKDDIIKAAEKGILKGTGERTFSPDLPLNRAMFVTILGRLAGADEKGTSDFADVPSDAYYAPYVAWAAENNIASGISASSFAPDKNITREQMAVILNNFANAQGIELKRINRTNFTDSAEISPWAENGVNALTQAGIITGNTDNTFNPQGSATRAEAAVMIVRFIEECM